MAHALTMDIWTEVIEEISRTPAKISLALTLPGFWPCWYTFCLTMVAIVCYASLAFLIDKVVFADENICASGSFLTEPEGPALTDENLSPPTPMRQVLQTLFMPSFLEELVWRVILLPSLDTLQKNRWWLLWVIVGQSIYVGFHAWPMGPILSNLPGRMRRPGASRTFSDKRFLLLDFVLALILNLVFYGVTFVAQRGAAYPCILLHWLVVLVWQMALYGNERLLACQFYHLLTSSKISKASDEIPWPIRACSFFAGQGLLFSDPTPVHRVLLEMLSLLFAIFWILMIIGRVWTYWCNSGLLLGVKLCLSVGYLVVAIFIPISIWHTRRSKTYRRHVSLLVQDTEELKDFVQEQEKLQELDKNEESERWLAELREDLLSGFRMANRNTGWLGAREMLVGISFGIVCGVWMILYALEIAVPSYVERFELQRSDLTPGFFLQYWACFVGFACASMPLAVETRYAALQVIKEQILVAKLVPSLFQRSSILADQTPRDPSASEWKHACKRYLRLNSELKDISQHSLALFVSFYSALMTANVMQGAAMWFGGQGSAVVSLLSLAFMIAFLFATLRISFGADKLSDIALKCIEVGAEKDELSPKSPTAERLETSELSYADLVKSHPTGWFVGPVRIGMSLLLTLSLPFVSNLLLRSWSLIRAKFQDLFKSHSKSTSHERILSPVLTQDTAVQQAVKALTLLPSREELLALAAISLVYIGVASSIAKRTKFIHHKFAIPGDVRKWLGVVRALVAPCLLEELFWRWLLLPSPNLEAGEIIPQVVYVTTLFVMAHSWPTGPILAMLPGRACRPGAVAVFREPRFLLLVLCLGATLATAYYVTQGALWPCVVLHWLTVALWLYCFDGDEDMKASARRTPQHWNAYWAKFLLNIGLALALGGAFASYVVALVFGGASGLPMLSKLLIQNPTKQMLAMFAALSASLSIVGRSVLTLRMPSQHRHTHALGIFSLACFGFSVVTPACVEGRGWERFLKLFEARGIGCALHVLSALLSFATGIADMWVVRRLLPAQGKSEFLRTCVRAICTCA